MEVSRSPRGLIIDLITPLRKGGEIDGSGLGKQLERVLPYVHALFLASPYMGEGNHLKPAQIEELLDRVMVVVRGRVPILVWISRSTEEETRETLVLLKKRLKTQNYTGPVFWVDTPLYYHSNRGLPQYYRNLFATLEDSFILHNDPELIKHVGRPLKRNNIRTSILKDLAQIDRIQGLIFFGSLDRANHYQKAVRSRSDFRIYDGDESHFLSHPSVSGVLSRGANLSPKAWQKITTSSLNWSGDQKDYPDYLKQIWEVGGYLSNLKNIYDHFPVPLIKFILSDMGIIESPTSTVSEEDMGEKAKRIKELMAEYGDYP